MIALEASVLISHVNPDDLHHEAATSLLMPDCCALDVATHHRSDLATFDDALAAAGRRRGVRVLP